MARIFYRPSAKKFLLCACLVLAALQVAGCSSREQRAQNYYERGKTYVANKDYVKARIEFRNALQLNDKLVDAWRALAQLDEQDKNVPGMVGELRRVVELDPKDVDSKVRLARLFLMGGALDQALKTTDAALELDPNNANTLALKAAILFRQKNIEGAQSAAGKALEIDPGNPEATVVMGVLILSRGDPAGALDVLAKVKPDHSDDLGVLFLKVNIYQRMGDLVQTEAVLRKLMDRYPEQPAFRAQLIRFYLANQRQDDALKEQRAAVAAKPDDIKTGLELVGLVSAIQGPAAAREELVNRISAGGRVFPYQVALARFDFSRGNTAEGTKLMRELITGSTAPEDVLIARTTLAEMYLSQKDVAAAEPLINDILTADARNANGLRLRASIRLDRGQSEEAIADLRTALNDQPRSPELLASLALAYERSGSIELADKAFSDATKASNYAPAVGLNYVAFLRRRGLAPQAETIINDLASRNPTNVSVLSALAQIKLARQDWAGAHEIATAISRLDNKNDLADQINGAAFVGEKKFDDSLALLQSASAANPTSIRPLAAMVGIYLQSKQVDKAEAAVKDALKANPANPEALVLMGSLALLKNDADQAAANFQAAIAAQPKDVVGYRAMADLYGRQNKPDDAIKVIRAGLEQQPQDFTLRLTLAGLLETKQDYDAAIAEYETLLKAQPGSMIVANNLASILADHRTDKASLDRANSLTAVLAKSQIPQFKDTLGWIAYLRANYPAAVTLLESAVAQLPNVPAIRYHLGMTYLATKQDAKAAEQFDKARELAPNDAGLKTKIDAALSGRPEKPKG